MVCMFCVKSNLTVKWLSVEIVDETDVGRCASVGDENFTENGY